MINGVDYTLPLIAIGSFLILFAIQFLLCRYVRSRFLRSLPWAWVVLALGAAAAMPFTEASGFLDLRSAFALLFCGYAAVCAAGIGLAHLICKLQKR